MNDVTKRQQKRLGKRWRQNIEKGEETEAILRHSKIAAMLSFIGSCKENDGKSMLEIQSHMLQEFGLKFDTTERYVKKCATVGFLKEQQGRWFVTSLCKEVIYRGCF